MSIEELYEILLSAKPSIEIKKNEDRIFSLIPELTPCKGFNQNSIWHIYDVYEHILHVIDNVPNVLELRLAALFHDIGKPLTNTIDENNNGHFYNHWNKSKEIFINFANKYKLNKELTLLVGNLIYYHDLNLEKNSNEITSIIDKIGKDNISLLFDLKRADLLAQSKEYHYLLQEYDKQEEKIKKLIK